MTMEVEEKLTTEDVRQWLLKKVAKTLIVSYKDIDCDAHLTEVGLDSQEALSLVADLEDLIGNPLPASVMEDIGSINQLVHISSQLEQ